MMKYPTLTKLITVGILTALSVLWIGCEPEHLSAEKHAQHVAPMLGLEPSDIKLLSYCDYRAARSFEGERILTSKGFIALSDEHIYLIARNEKQLRARGIVRVPIAEISSLALAPTQFHLHHKNLQVIIWLNEAPNKKLTQQKYDTVAQLFENEGVSTTEVIQEYEIAQLKTRPRYKNFNSGFYNSGFDYNDGFRADYNTSYGSPYTVGGAHDIE